MRFSEKRRSLICVIRFLAGGLLVGCDSQEESFEVAVRVEDQSGEPVQGAEVSVQPCYSMEGTVKCNQGDVANALSAQAGGASKAVELQAWYV